MWLVIDGNQILTRFLDKRDAENFLDMYEIFNCCENTLRVEWLES